MKIAKKQETIKYKVVDSSEWCEEKIAGAKLAKNKKEINHV